MGVFINKSGAIYFDGYNIKNWVSACNLEWGCEPQDATCIGHDTRQNIAGLETAKVDFEGYDDYAAGAIDTIFNPIDGDRSVIITMCPQGVATQGNGAYTFLADTFQYNKALTIGEMAKFKIHSENTGAKLVSCKVLAGDQSAGSNSNTSAYAWQAIAASETMYASLHVTTAATDLVVKIQSDDNSGFTSPTDRITFATTSAIGAEQKTVAGAVADTYWRVLWTRASGTAVFTVVAGIR
jgi:hypothetical protein